MTYQGKVFKETPAIMQEMLKRFPGALAKSDDKKRGHLLETLMHCNCFTCRFVRHFVRFSVWPDFV